MSYINHYIDRTIIDEYADKNFTHGYSLDVSDIPPHEITNLSGMLFEQDKAFKEIVLNYIQEKIDERLPEIESDYRHEMRYSA